MNDKTTTETMTLPHIAADQDFSSLIVLCNDLLTKKGADYTQGATGDYGRLKNFYASAKRWGVTPRQVLAIYWGKHLAAIETFIQQGQVESEPIRGRIADAINYLVLLDKMIRFEARCTPEERERYGVVV